MPGKILYCGCISNEKVYRKYNNDNIAIWELKKIAIKRNGDLTDISKKIMLNKKVIWSRISWIK